MPNHDKFPQPPFAQGRVYSVGERSISDQAGEITYRVFQSSHFVTGEPQQPFAPPSPPTYQTAAPAQAAAPAGEKKPHRRRRPRGGKPAAGKQEG